MGRWIAKLKVLNSILIIFIISFILLEIILRLSLSYIVRTSFVKPVFFLMNYSEEFYWTYKPNLNLMLKYRDVPLHSFITDKLGFRNSVLHDNPDILLIGDSFTASDGVGNNKTWSYLLEKETGEKINNLGVNGYGPTQEIKVLEYALKMWKPKYVMWCFFQNDIYNANHECRLRFNKFSRTIFNNSLTASAFLNTFLFLKNSGNIFKGMKPSYTIVSDNLKVTTHPFWEQYLYTYETASIMAMPGYKKSIKILDRAKKLTDTSGTKFMVLFIPAKEQAYDVSNKLTEHARELEKVSANIYNIPLLLETHCKKNNIAFFSPLKDLQRYNSQQIFYTIDGHLNEKGNEIVAKSIINYLFKQ